MTKEGNDSTFIYNIHEKELQLSRIGANLFRWNLSDICTSMKNSFFNTNHHQDVQYRFAPNVHYFWGISSASQIKEPELIKMQLKYVNEDKILQFNQEINDQPLTQSRKYALHFNYFSRITYNSSSTGEECSTDKINVIDNVFQCEIINEHALLLLDKDKKIILCIQDQKSKWSGRIVVHCSKAKSITLIGYRTVNDQFVDIIFGIQCLGGDLFIYKNDILIQQFSKVQQISPSFESSSNVLEPNNQKLNSETKMKSNSKTDSITNNSNIQTIISRYILITFKNQSIELYTIDKEKLILKIDKSLLNAPLGNINAIFFSPEEQSWYVTSHENSLIPRKDKEEVESSLFIEGSLRLKQLDYNEQHAQSHVMKIFISDGKLGCYTVGTIPVPTLDYISYQSNYIVVASNSSGFNDRIFIINQDKSKIPIQNQNSITINEQSNQNYTYFKLKDSNSVVLGICFDTFKKLIILSGKKIDDKTKSPIFFGSLQSVYNNLIIYSKNIDSIEQNSFKNLIGISAQDKTLSSQKISSYDEEIANIDSQFTNQFKININENKYSNINEANYRENFHLTINDKYKKYIEEEHRNDFIHEFTNKSSISGEVTREENLEKRLSNILSAMKPLDQFDPSSINTTNEIIKNRSTPIKIDTHQTQNTKSYSEEFENQKNRLDRLESKVDMISKKLDKILSLLTK